MVKIYIGSDHAGFEYKEQLKKYLAGLGHQVDDKGAFAYEEGDDYPDFITPVAESVAGDKESFGVILGGSGQGEAMCANKVAGVRAAVFYGEVLPIASVDVTGEKSVDPFEIVILERKHNNANILSIGVRFLSVDEAKFASELFVSTAFSGEERHLRRINKF